MSFCILRTAKLTTLGNIAASGEHNFRERKTDNADQARTHLNQTTGAQSTKILVDHIKARLATVPKVRKNAVLALEYFFGASPEWFHTATEKQRESYFDNAEKWLIQRHGAENVIAFTRQYDETSPHVCAYVVPIDPKGKLNCSHFQDGRVLLQAMQTDFAARVGSPAGLERGIEGSTATHTSIKEYYGTVNKPSPQVKTQVPKVAPATTSETLAEAVGVYTEHSAAVEAAEAARKKRSKEIAANNEANRLQANQYALIKRNAAAQTAAIAHYRETAVQLRQIPLESVLERFGAIPDPKDKQNWRTQCGRITVTGEKFFNHDLATGGGGAIDLVMHLESTDYKAAVKLLATEFGTGAVLSQMAATAKAEIIAAVAAPKVPFSPPPPAPEHWPTVRQYLTDVRKISERLIDGLKAQGQIYADQYKNCVFVLRGSKGVELRGTGEMPYHGIRGQKNGFLVKKGNSDLKNVAFVESSIDALSLYELGQFEGRIIATGGNAAAFAASAADEYRAKGYQIYSAFDQATAGEAQSLALGQAVRLRPVLKDWNADLVASKVKIVVLPPEKNRDVDNSYARMRC